MNIYQQHKEIFIQFIKFNIIGILNTIIDFLVFFILVNIIAVNPISSQGISYSCGLINSYICNKNLTFKCKNKKIKSEFFKFICVNLISLMISMLCIYFFINIFVLSLIFVKIICIFFTVSINYLGSKYWVFKKKILHIFLN